MNEETKNERKKWHIGLLMLISFVLFNLGFIIDQTIRWSNHLQGFVNGVFHLFFFGVSWGIFFIPWSLMIYGLYRWRKWERFRTHWILAPAVVVFLLTIGDLVVNPPSPSNRFQRFAKTELPGNARNLQCHFSGGGVADYGDFYYFETTPEEVDRLIAEMNLSEDEYQGPKNISLSPNSPRDSFPDFSKWKGVRQYRGWDDRQHWYFHLVTDATRTKVYIMMGCI